MTDSPVVGSASFELRATKDKLKQDLRESERDLKGFVDGAERTAGAGAGRIGGAISSMALSVTTVLTGLVTLLGLAAVGAFNLGMQGMQMADDIANTARKIGVGTNALQEWRFVAKQTGGDAKDADAALDKFADKLAQATAGTSKSATKAFNLLGIGPEELRSFKSTEDALDTITDRIKGLKSEADRAAVAEALGLGSLSSALRDGAVDIAKLRDEAQSLGIVMDQEMVRRASQAQGEFDTLSQIIDVNLKSAFIDLAPAIMAAIGLVADLARALSDAMDAWRDLDSKTTRGLQREAARLSAENNNLISRYGSPLGMNGREADRPTVPGSSGGAAGVGGAMVVRSMQPGARETYENNQRRLNEIFEQIKAREDTAAPSLTNRSSGGSLTLPPPRADNSAQRAAEREARRAERVEQEIFKARQRLLRVAEDDILTAQQRYDLAREQLKMDREARDAEIQSKADRGEIKAAERRQLDAANAEADALEDRLLTDNAFREIQDERLATEKLLSGLTADLLSLQSGAARTAKERQRIELDLLEIRQRERREALRLELERNPNLTQAQREAAMATNGRIERGERDAVIRNNLSPLERWRDESLKTADEIAEAYENVAARGLDALNDGLVDAIMNSRNLGEVFSNVARQILADLLKISVRRGITEPLADMLFGGSGSGVGSGSGGGIGSSIFSAIKSALKIPGFSSGVSNFGGGLAYVHAGEILANLPQGTDVIPAHAVQAMGSRSSVSRIVVTTNDDRFNAYVDDRAARPAAAAFSTARKTVPADMARTDRYTLGRRR
ncbi:hypothetical protein [Brevundimonas sp. Marseille-Q4549]